MPGNYTLRRTYVDGDILSASDYVADHQQHIDNQTPQGTDDYSLSTTQMRTLTDTGDVNTESLATSLAGELERIRYVLQHIKTTLNGSAVAQWYSKSYSVLVANGTVTSAKLANGATHIQFIRTEIEDDAIPGGTGESVMITQAITTSRTRVRARGALHLLYVGGGAAALTIRLRRDTVAFVDSVVSLITSGEQHLTVIIEGLDTVAVGNHTYDISVQSSTGNGLVLVDTGYMVLEEVA